MGMSESEDAAQFEVLMRLHLDRLYRLAFRLSGTVSDAEDLIQDLLIKLYGRKDELSSIDDLAPWLSRVLYNQFVDGRRRYKRERMTVVPDTLTGEDGSGHVETAASRCPDAETAAAQEIDIKRIQAAISQLSENHQTVILLHDSEGYTLQEIHRITGAAVGTLKSRLHRARARLRDLLGDGTFST